jgi:competence protein ComFB
MNNESAKKYIEYELVNITEEVVKKKVRELMAGMDMCLCEKCYCDACALVLNALRPHYVTTEKGLLLTMLSAENSQFKADLTTAVLQALMTVKASPKH